MPLPLSQGYKYVLSVVDTTTGTTGEGFAYPVPSADQAHNVKALQHLTVA